MGERIGSGASPADSRFPGDDHARVFELLNSKAWEKRLEEARLQREKVLAEKAARAGLRALSDAVEDGEQPTGVQGDARVATALRTLRQAESAAAEEVGNPALPPGLRVEAEASAPASKRRGFRSARALRPVPALPVNASQGAQRLETALARARVARLDGGAGRWRGRLGRFVFVAMAFAMGLIAGIAAVRVAGLIGHGAASVVATPESTRGPIAAAIPAASDLPSGQSLSHPIAAAGPVAFRPAQEAVLSTQAPVVPAVSPGLPVPDMSLAGDVRTTPVLADPGGVPLLGSATLPPARPATDLAVAPVPPRPPVAEPAPRGPIEAPEPPGLVALAHRPVAAGMAHAGPVPTALPPMPVPWAGGQSLSAPSARLTDQAVPQSESPVQMVALPTAPAGRLALVQPPAPQPAAAPPPPMPAPDVFVRVFVTNAVSDDGIAKTVASLDGAGYDMAPPARVRVVIAETDVRFFHRQDAEAARVLAEHLDGVTRDFTGAARKPRPGQLELWLAGGARQPQPARTTQPEMRTVRPPTQAATSRRSQAPAQTTTAAELRNEVLRKLREVNSQ